MRFPIQIIMLALCMLALAGAGCGPKNNEPKAIKVTDDPAIQRSVVPFEQKPNPSTNEGPVPSDK